MRCDLEGAPIHYDSFGSGRPLVVLHGMPLDRHASIHEFEPILSARTGWRRIYPDLPGHGETAGAAAVTTPDELLGVLAEFVTAVLGNTRLVLAGTSFGGYLARGLVHRLGGRIDGLCLNVPAVVRDTTGTRAPRLVVADEEAIAAKSRDDGWAWYGELAVADSAANREYAAAVNEAETDAAYLEALHGSGTPCSFERETLPTPLAAPTLILAGRQDNVVGYEAALSILPSYPRATLAVLDRAGHMLRGEQPLLFAALVNEWLDRVEEWIGAGRPGAGG
ncbi:MAG: alpha/beta hydrolase [Acidimicrobiales bacterium]|jgi:pimeloyl-ACP methyl ester carboxylesterase